MKWASGPELYSTRICKWAAPLANLVAFENISSEMFSLILCSFVGVIHIFNMNLVNMTSTISSENLQTFLLELRGFGFYNPMQIKIRRICLKKKPNFALLSSYHPFFCTPPCSLPSFPPPFFSRQNWAGSSRNTSPVSATMADKALYLGPVNNGMPSVH